MRNSTTEYDDTMETMYEDDMYRHLGHVQAKQIKHARMKQRLVEKYLNRTKSILKTQLNGKNTIKAINIYATAVLTVSCGMVKLTATDLEKLQNKMRNYSRDTDFTTPVLQWEDLLYRGKWVAED